MVWYLDGPQFSAGGACPFRPRHPTREVAGCSLQVFFSSLHRKLVILHKPLLVVVRGWLFSGSEHSAWIYTKPASSTSGDPLLLLMLDVIVSVAVPLSGLSQPTLRLRAVPSYWQSSLQARSVHCVLLGEGLVRPSPQFGRLRTSIH